MLYDMEDSVKVLQRNKDIYIYIYGLPIHKGFLFSAVIHFSTSTRDLIIACIIMNVTTGYHYLKQQQKKLL